MTLSQFQACCVKEPFLVTVRPTNSDKPTRCLILCPPRPIPLSGMQKHMQLRNQRRDTHTARKPPTVEEVALVHDLIRNHHLARTLASHHHHHSPSADAVPMARTGLQSSVLMHR